MKKLFALALVLSMVIGLVPALASGNNVANVSYGGGTPQSGDPALNSASSGSNIIKLSHAGLLGFHDFAGEAGDDLGVDAVVRRDRRVRLIGACLGQGQ